MCHLQHLVSSLGHAGDILEVVPKGLSSVGRAGEGRQARGPRCIHACRAAASLSPKSCIFQGVWGLFNQRGPPNDNPKAQRLAAVEVSPVTCGSSIQALPLLRPLRKEQRKQAGSTSSLQMPPPKIFDGDICSPHTHAQSRQI